MAGLTASGCPVALLTMVDRVLSTHLHGDTYCTIDASSNIACVRLVAGIAGAVAGSRILFEMPA